LIEIILSPEIFTAPRYGKYGLVTEDEHPDWVNLSVEEMYKRLREEAKNQEKKPIQGSLANGVFVSVDGRRYGKK